MPSSASQPLPHEPLARIGRWHIRIVPHAWEIAEGFGIAKTGPDARLHSVNLTEDVLLAGNSLALYVEAQKTILKRTFAEPSIVGPTAIPFPEAEEAMLMMIKHRPLEGQPVIVQAQTYVRRGTWIGIATLTTTEQEMPTAKGSYQAFTKSLRIAEEEPRPSGEG